MATQGRPWQPEIWQRLQQMRREMGLSDSNDAEFARRLGVEPAAYSNWKLGTNGIGAESILEVARRTGYRAEWIWTGAKPKQSIRPTHASVAAYSNGWRDAIFEVQDALHEISTPPPERDTRGEGIDLVEDLDAVSPRSSEASDDAD